MTSYPTPEQTEQLETLEQLRARMREAQIAKANAHNDAKHGRVHCSCGSQLHKFYRSN